MVMLNKEDITSLGFDYGEYSKKEVNGDIIELHKVYEDTDIYTIHIIGEYERELVFKGVIEDKNEFIKVLKMVYWTIVW